MKFFRIPTAEHEYKVTPQSLEDLWVLSQLVEKGDEAEGSSFRRFKSQKGKGDVAERGESGEKKPVHLRVRVESVEFAESANRLRMTGIILSGTPEEFVQAGEHHTLDVEIGRGFTLAKTLSEYHRQLIEESQATARQVKAVVLMIDDEKASAYSLTSRGTRALFEFRNQANKRFPATYDSLHSQYYSELLHALVQQDASTALVIAGPGFERESFKKFLGEKSPELSKRASVVHANSAERPGLNELLKNGLLESILGKQKLHEEFKALEEFKKHVAKNDGWAEYGIEAVTGAVQSGAVELLMIADELLRTDEKAGALVKKTKNAGARILVFHSDDDAGCEFAGFGIACMRRYPKSF